jgi:hydrogenase maturation protease
MSADLLVAGIGNIFLSDDGFGVEVAERLADHALPPGVVVTDFGIRGVHLAYELLDGYRGLVLIDAVPMGEEPGTLVVMEPDDERSRPEGDEAAAAFDAHSMSPGVVLSTLRGLGGSVGRTLVVGCQPGCLDEGIGLSPAVAAAVPVAVELCLQVVADLIQPAGKGMTGCCLES